jgi:hypothetical protein
MKSYSVTVTDTRSIIIQPDDINRQCFIYNTTNDTLYIGGADVTTANGLPILKHTAPIEGGLPLKDTLYGIAEAGKSLDIRILIPTPD